MIAVKIEVVLDYTDGTSISFSSLVYAVTSSLLSLAAGAVFSFTSNTHSSRISIEEKCR